MVFHFAQSGRAKQAQYSQIHGPKISIRIHWIFMSADQKSRQNRGILMLFLYLAYADGMHTLSVQLAKLQLIEPMTIDNIKANVNMLTLGFTTVH